jgi:hypothetical protein
MAGFDKFLKNYLKTCCNLKYIYFSKIIVFCEGKGSIFLGISWNLPFVETNYSGIAALKENEASEVMNHLQFWKLTFLS